MQQQSSLSHSNSVDDLLPKQLLPLPETAAYGASDLAPAAAAAAEIAAEAAAEAATAAQKGLSEEEEHELMQKAAEAYLMSVHLEAKSLPACVAADGSQTISRKAETQVLEKALDDTTVKSSNTASYVQRLLRLQEQQDRRSPPLRAWETEALDFFKRIRVWLQEQRDLQQQQHEHLKHSQQQKQQEQPLQLHLRCLEWTADEWRLYCRMYPPTLVLLLQWDVRCCCLLLQLLLDDLELQVQHHASRENATTGGNEAAGAEATDAEAPAHAAGCCQVSGSPISLPQLFWLFAVLAALDEIEALRFEVSYELQKLRRRCLRVRGVLLELLACANKDNKDSNSSLKLLQMPLPFLAGLCSSTSGTEDTKIFADAVQQQQGKVATPAGATNNQMALKQQLAAVDVVLVIIRDFFGQK